MSYTTNGMIGIDLDAVTAGTTTDGANAKYTLGTRAAGNNNSEWIYVQAAEAISTTTKEPFALAVDENFQARKLTKALAIVGHIIAVAPAQIIADNALAYAELLKEHIAKEDDILYPLAERVLPETMRDGIIAGYAAAEAKTAADFAFDCGVGVVKRSDAVEAASYLLLVNESGGRRRVQTGRRSSLLNSAWSRLNSGLPVVSSLSP